MARTAPRPSRRGAAQRGQVLLGIVVILGIVFGALFYNFVSPANSTIESDKITNAALAQAKEALIGYASSQRFTGSGERPGDLPCPDRDNNGAADDGKCDTVATRIGRLPWKTLGVPDLRDGAGERLWYAVSNSFKDNSRTGILNSDTPGEYAVTGNTPGNNVIAIVFAPGPALGTQLRDAANQNNVANYLEGENANGDTTFTTALPSGSFNDKLLLITSDTFFPNVEMRVAREARSGLLAFYNTNGFFPYANDYGDSTYRCTDNQYSGRIPRFTSFPLSRCRNGSDPNWKGVAWPNWFFGNNWHLVLFYAVSPKCSDRSNTSCGGPGAFLTVNGIPAPNNNIRALVMTPGRGFAGQNRPCAAADDCLEDPENTNGDDVFVKPVPSPANNDHLVIVAP
ncbi:MAG: hypothetical protein K2Y16_02025 [Burkholderiales bacterium]|nr:hypothetical protein [Burkholderiales bacterium]